MIRVVRSKIPQPEVFSSPSLLAMKRSTVRFYSQPPGQREQRVFDWEQQTALLRQGDCLGELVRLFHGKCAYCESPIVGKSQPNLDFFRPRRGALALDGTFSPDHYWWLAYKWSNYLPVCDLCNSAKGQRFPTLKVRAAAGTYGVRLAAEQPLLLDPCKDEPERHLIFGKAGKVSSATPQGQCTIEVLALNRESLVQERSRRLDVLEAVLEKVLSGHKPSIHALKEELSAEATYLAAKRQLVRTRLTDLQSVMSERDLDVLHIRGAKRMNVRRVIKAETAFERLQVSKQRHSVEDEGKAAQRAYFSGKRRIERVEISNFKKIRHLELTVPAATNRESWLMLLGENATGKSSFLQAIALALLGRVHLDKLALDARNYLARGEQAGYVKIHLTNVLGPVELTFSADSSRFTVKPARELVLLLGYGATRLLPRRPRKEHKPERYVRVKNLFDPYARLQHAERWLTDVDRVSPRDFNHAITALRKLLMLGDENEVKRDGRRVFIQTSDGPCTLRQLSDGYQSMVALAVDIMMGLTSKWERMELAEGIVLIDEIESHLHPVWKMEIVGRFRKVFPRLQFFVTTHDALCLRGLSPGEVVIFTTGPQGSVAEVVKHDLDHLRADQLLTSPLFGLVSTREPKVQIDTDLYSKLLGKSNRTAAENQTMRHLGDKLRNALLVGESLAARKAEAELQNAAAMVVGSASAVMAEQPPSAEPDEEIERQLRDVFGEGSKA